MVVSPATAVSAVSAESGVSGAAGTGKGAVSTTAESTGVIEGSAPFRLTSVTINQMSSATASRMSSSW